MFIQAGLLAASLISKQIAKNKQKDPTSFDNTAYGKRLKQLMTEGKYSDQQEANMMNKTGGTLGNQAQMATTDYTNRLLGNNMGGSIAGQRGLNEIQATRSQNLSDAVMRIKMEDENSKSQAASDYAKGKTERSDQIRAMQNQQQTDSFGDISQAIGGIGGLVGQNAQMQNSFDLFKQKDQFTRDQNDDQMKKILEMIKGFQQ